MSSKPIIPWIGGKRRLLKDILPLIPPHITYVEPFAGGMTVLFAKEPSKCEVVNDINADLINLYRVVQNHLVAFIECFKYALVSRQMFEWEQLKTLKHLPIFNALRGSIICSAMHLAGRSMARRLVSVNSRHRA